MKNDTKKGTDKVNLISRRRWLQSSVAAIALPSLEILAPAKAAAQQASQNFLVYYLPNGRLRDGWNPSRDGNSIRFPSNSAALNPWANRIAAGTMGIENKPAKQSSPGAAHAIACTTSMTGRRGNFGSGRSTAAKTFDQYIADKIGGNTAFKSLQYTSGEVGNGDRVDNGAAAVFTQCLSWASSNQSLKPNTSLTSAFNQLFGPNSGFQPPSGNNNAEPSSLGSILDTLTKDATRMKNALGTSDQQRLEQYFDGLRDVERRLQGSAVSANCAPDSYNRNENSFLNRIESWQDLMVLALQCGQTKVITYMIDWELSTREYPEIGAPRNHHGSSHYDSPRFSGNTAQVKGELAKIEKFQTERLASFIKKMNDTQGAGGQSLLDETLILVQPGFGQGAGHDNKNVVPLLVGGDGQIKTDGRMFSTSDLANVACSILDVFDIQGNLGVNGRRYGEDGTGRINDLFSNTKA